MMKLFFSITEHVIMWKDLNRYCNFTLWMNSSFYATLNPLTSVRPKTFLFPLVHITGDYGRCN